MRSGRIAAEDSASAGLPETCTSTSYATAPSGNTMMLAYPDQVTTVTGAYAGGSCPAPGSADIVSDVRNFYDDETGTISSMGTFGSLASPGGLTTGVQAAVSWPASGSETWQARSAARYDSYGRATYAANGNGKVTTTAYTPATQALATSTVATNPLGWTTKTTLDQGRQQPTAVTDVNSEVASESYDALGRRLSVTLPIDQGAKPSYTYSYSMNGTSPPAITTNTLREDGSYSVSVQIYDGLAQLRQVQTTTADNSAGRLISDTFYDSHGWQAKARAPYYDSTTRPGTTLFVANDANVPTQTVTGYDGQGRVISSAFYSLGTLQWQTTTAYPGMNETDVTPPVGGTATSVFTNSRGDKSASWAYVSSATPTGNAADADVTSYSYNAAGLVSQIANNNGNAWTYGYDLLGYKVSATDPGTTGSSGPSGHAGTTLAAYDANGNITSVTDPLGQVLTYSYDALDRKTAEFNATPGVPNEPVQLAAWQYDSVAKGQLTSSTSYDASGAAYVEAVTGYNSAYEPTGSSLTIPASQGALQTGTSSNQYTTSTAYTPLTGLPEFTSYSNDGNLPAETVSYSYDLQGLLTQYGSGNAYLDDTSFTPQGQPLRTTFGPFGEQLVQAYTYDAGTNRLLQAATDLQPLSSAADTVSYTYDQAGNITSASDAQNTGGTQTQCYQYNNLGELTTAWTDSGGTTTAPGPSVAGIGGCTNASPSAASIGGPAPYWQSYTYDLLGDRTGEMIHDTASVALDTTANEITQQAVYPGADTGTSPPTQATTPQTQPDAAQTLTATGPGGTATTTNAYNADGQTKTIGTATTGASPPAAPPGATVAYNPQGQVASVTTSTGTSSYLYDAGGNLLIQKNPGQTILYADGGAEQIILVGSALSGLRIFRGAPDGTAVVESSAGTISYEVANQQHTATDAISAASDAITRRYFDPWGNPVGTPPAWPDSNSFLGRPQDPATTFDLLGARQYDPLTGAFLSLDPLFETGSSPLQMGGYSYAANNPVTNSDPTGLAPGFTCGGMPCPTPGSGNSPHGDNGGGGNNGQAGPGGGSGAIAAGGSGGLGSSGSGGLGSSGIIRHLEMIIGSSIGITVIPYGFANESDFINFSATIQSGLSEAGLANARVFFRGSSVEGFSYNPRHLGRPFDGGPNPSDYDLALVDPNLLAQAKDMGFELRDRNTRTGPLEGAEAERLGLKQLQDELSAETGGRDVSFMVYGSEEAVAARPGSYLPVADQAEIDAFQAQASLITGSGSATLVNPSAGDPGTPIGIPGGVSGENGGDRMFD